MSTARAARDRSAPSPWACLMAVGGMFAASFAFAPSGALAADRETGLARLVGVWQLDQRVSQDPHRILRQAERRSGSRQGQGKPGSAFGQRATMVTDGANVLTIACREDEVTLTDWNDAVRTLHVDGKKWPAERGGIAVEVRAGWKSSDRLVVKTTGTPGGWIRETYELGGRGDKLFVRVELQRLGSRFPFAFDRVYDRAGERK